MIKPSAHCVSRKFQDSLSVILVTNAQSPQVKNMDIKISVIQHSCVRIHNVDTSHGPFDQKCGIATRGVQWTLPL
jgi:hypothetical protein